MLRLWPGNSSAPSALRSTASPAAVTPGTAGGGWGSIVRGASTLGEVGAGWGSVGKGVAPPSEMDGGWDCVDRGVAPPSEMDGGWDCIDRGVAACGADHGGPDEEGAANGLEDDLRCTVLCWVGSDQGRVAAAWPPIAATRLLCCIIMAPMSDPGLPQEAPPREEAVVRRPPSGAGGTLKRLRAVKEAVNPSGRLRLSPRSREEGGAEAAGAVGGCWGWGWWLEASLEVKRPVRAKCCRMSVARTWSITFLRSADLSCVSVSRVVAQAAQNEGRGDKQDGARCRV